MLMLHLFRGRYKPFFLLFFHSFSSPLAGLLSICFLFSFVSFCTFFRLHEKLYSFSSTFLYVHTVYAMTKLSHIGLKLLEKIALF